MIVALFDTDYEGFKTAVRDLGARDMVFSENGQFQAAASASDGGIAVVIRRADKPTTFDADFPKAVRATYVNP